MVLTYNDSTYDSSTSDGLTYNSSSSDNLALQYQTEMRLATWRLNKKAKKQ